jgi:hypothetical protein
MANRAPAGQIRLQYPDTRPSSATISFSVASNNGALLFHLNLTTWLRLRGGILSRISPVCIEFSGLSHFSDRCDWLNWFNRSLRTIVSFVLSQKNQ